MCVVTSSRQALWHSVASLGVVFETSGKTYSASRLNDKSVVGPPLSRAQKES